VQRLELTRVRACERCGRGRADLTAGTGDVLTIALDPAAVAELQGSQAETDVAWLSSFVVERSRAHGESLREVVLDEGPNGLRGLLTVSRGDATDVLACSPDQALTLAMRATLPLYATAEALDAGARREPSGGDRLH
jgi:hypothetical protein